jgi:hypothetical protein
MEMYPCQRCKTYIAIWCNNSRNTQTHNQLMDYGNRFLACNTWVTPTSHGNFFCEKYDSVGKEVYTFENMWYVFLNVAIR